MDADWSLSALISIASMLAAIVLLSTWVNRRIDLSRVDLGVGAATTATRFLIRASIVVGIWLAVAYGAAILRVLLLRT